MTMKFATTALSAVLALAAITGQAAAQDNHATAIANDVLVKNIHEMIDQSQNRTFELVMAKAETGIELKLAKIENFVAPKPVRNEAIVIANNGL